MPLLKLILAADRTATAAGDAFTYTIFIRNTGTVPALDVVVTAPVPAGASFVPASVSVNNIPLPGADPAAGIPIGIIPAGGSAEASYRVQVIAVNDPPVLANTASAAAAFQLIPEGPVEFEQTSAEPLIIPELFVALAGVKASDVPAAIVGDIVTYTVQITNSGNAVAANAVLSDSIPEGTTAVPGSILVNNLPQTGSDPSAIDLGDIAPAETVTVTFEIHVDIVPSTRELVNRAAILSEVALPLLAMAVSQPPVQIPPNVIPIFDPNLAVQKQANRTVTAIGDTITYSVTLNNSGNTVLRNISVTDSPPAGTQFVPGSVTVNGIPESAANLSTGFSIGQLSSGQSTVIAYQVRVTTAENSITNQAQAAFVPVLPGRTLPSITKPSNQVTIAVLNPDLNIRKKADLTEAELGGIITYTIVAANSGNTNLNNVIVADPLPAGTQFVAGSVIVNGAPQLTADPATGIHAGSLTPGKSVTVSHQVRVIVDDSSIVNQAQAAFTPDIPGLALPPRTKTSNQIVIPVIEEEE